MVPVVQCSHAMHDCCCDPCAHLAMMTESQPAGCYVQVVGGIEAGGEDPADRAERLALKAMSRIEKTKDPNKKRELEAKLAKIMTVLGKGTTKAAAAAAASTAQASKKFKPGAGATDGFEFKYSTVPAAGILGKRAVSLLAPGEKAKRQQRAQRFAADEEMCEREEGDEVRGRRVDRHRTAGGLAIGCVQGKQWRSGTQAQVAG